MFLDGFILIKKLILKNIIVNYLCFFTHWRKGDEDLLKSFNSFEESFKSAKGQIEKKQEEYEKKGVNLDDVEAISQYIDDNTCSEYFAPG